MKSCIIFAVSIFEESKLHVLQEFLNVFKEKFSDCDYYIGINYGSVPSVEEMIDSYQLNAEIVRLTDPSLYAESDASAYQLALWSLKKSKKSYELYWFAHTKGGVNYRPNERSLYLNKLFGNRLNVEALFSAHEFIGTYALRGVSGSAAGDVWATFNRDHHIDICSNKLTKELPCTHVNWSYIETMYVMNKHVVETFLEISPKQFYDTKIEERCYFEVIFPWIATRLGYFPYIEEPNCFFGNGTNLKDITRTWIYENNLHQLLKYLDL